jgi:hypothetical protein
MKYLFLLLPFFAQSQTQDSLTNQYLNGLKHGKWYEKVVNSIFYTKRNYEKGKKVGIWITWKDACIVKDLILIQINFYPLFLALIKLIWVHLKIPKILNINNLGIIFLKKRLK